MDTWEGIPTRGTPGTRPPTGNIPHIQNSAWYGDADGNDDGLGPLQILCTVPPAPEPPEELRTEGYFRAAFDPTPATPGFAQVVYPPSPFSAGWTQNPVRPDGSPDPNARYVVGLDTEGDPIFGTPPSTGGEALALSLIRTGAAMLTALGK